MARRAPKLDELVLVEWEDAHNAAGWHDLPYDGRDDEPVTMVGFVVEWADDVIVLSMSRKTTAGEVGNVWTIPTSLLRSWRRLR